MPQPGRAHPDHVYAHFSHLCCSVLNNKVSGKKKLSLPSHSPPTKAFKACTDVIFSVQSSHLHWTCFHLRRVMLFHIYTWLRLSTAAAAQFAPAAMIPPLQMNATIAVASEEHYQGASAATKSSISCDRSLWSCMCSKWDLLHHYLGDHWQAKGKKVTRGALKVFLSESFP